MQQRKIVPSGTDVIIFLKYFFAKKWRRKLAVLHQVAAILAEKGS
jgi:hypothetical protein